MALEPGTRLGSYEILSLLGVGGMGEVYRARDTKLKRDVAIKILPDEFSRDPDRVIRFQREAEVLASLNHPNIAAIYHLEEANGSRFLVLELVEGETLAERIKRGPLPVDEALSIAKSIGDALEAAHEKSVVHRDLKPANVKITPEGNVKVLDFGLAKAMQTMPSTTLSNSPTLFNSMAATNPGIIIGTAAYMSPEQARGKSVDKRADIWAFGVVLYELLTGEQLFKGEDIGEILAAVIKEEPRWERVPVRVQRLLKSCLEKDPKQRLRDIADARRLVDEAPEPVAAPSPSMLAKTAWALAGLFLITTLGVSFLHFRETPPAAPELMRFQIQLPDNVTPLRGGVISPDGLKIVFPAVGSDGVRRLWLRSLDSLDARPLSGAEAIGTRPFWSPDSLFVAFEAGDKLKKIDIRGGPVQTLCDIPGNVLGGSWNRDGIIIFGNNTRDGVMRVSAGGGLAAPLVAGPAFFPFFLPDGRHFVYQRPERGKIGAYLGSLDAKAEEQSSKPLVDITAGPIYAPSADPATGYLLFLRDDTLLAQPFDNRRFEITGEPTAIAEPVGIYANDFFFSASDNGALLYRTGSGRQARLTWFDRLGKTLGSTGEPIDAQDLALSPDATRVAFTVRNPIDIWLLEFSRGVSTRFTFGGASAPVWSPDGKSIAFLHEFPASKQGLYRKASSGAGGEELLFQSTYNPPTDWSRDGRFLLYGTIDPKMKADLWVLPLEGGRKPFLFLGTDFNEADGRFSPDTRWIAYTSDESGANEIYVRPFNTSSSTGSPTPEGKWLVSKGGGFRAHWRRDGKELFYLAGNGNVMAVEVTTIPVFQAGAPKPLFQAPPAAIKWDVAPDGQRFLLPVLVNDTSRASFTMVLDWQAGLKK